MTSPKRSESFNKDDFGGKIVDVTDNVQCYENGKTFECECGQGFGVSFDEALWRCPTCGARVIDHKASEREQPERRQGQSGLSDFM
jgi:rubrerythrin